MCFWFVVCIGIGFRVCFLVGCCLVSSWAGLRLIGCGVFCFKLVWVFRFLECQFACGLLWECWWVMWVGFLMRCVGFTVAGFVCRVFEVFVAGRWLGGNFVWVLLVWWCGLVWWLLVLVAFGVCGCGAVMVVLFFVWCVELFVGVWFCRFWWCSIRVLNAGLWGGCGVICLLDCFVWVRV